MMQRAASLSGCGSSHRAHTAAHSSKSPPPPPPPPPQTAAVARVEAAVVRVVVVLAQHSLALCEREYLLRISLDVQVHYNVYRNV